MNVTMGEPWCGGKARGMATTATPARQATYREVLTEPRFRLLFFTRSVAIAADTLRIVALSVLVFGLTRSPLLAAVTYGAGFLPQAIGGTLLGALADRIRPRPLLVTGYLMEAATAAALAMARLPVGACLALVACVASLTPVFGGASARLVAEVLPGDAYVLGRSLSNIAASAAQLLGLAAGGVAVATLGARHALLVSAGCHLLAAAVIRLRLPGLPAPGNSRRGPRLSVLRHSLRGNRALVTNRAVRVLLLANWLPPAFVTGAESLIVPYSARRGFPAGAPALMLACLPAGMIASDLAVGRLLPPATRERLTIPLMAAMGMPLFAFAFRPSLPMAAALLVLTGGGFGYTLGIQRQFLEAVPGPILGQAFGLLAMGLMTLQGMGPAVFGGLAQIIPTGLAMAIAGAATVITAVVLGVCLPAGTASIGHHDGSA
ncbi:MAG: MFS transporter [Micromonosporaceae bacterium]